MKQFFRSTISVFGFLVLMAMTPGIAIAASNPLDTTSVVAPAGKSDACDALTELDAAKGCGTGDNSINSIIASVINILSVVVGIAAVVMVIIAGFKYITSGGDSNGVSSAKNTLTYALVGLAVAASAQLLVHLALTTASPGPCKANAHFANNDARCVAPKPK